jgi:ubiquitin carboxyl-terminal hydrolase L3
MERTEMWIPLESNPEALTNFVHKIGVPDDWEVNGVFGFDRELLDMLPRPVAALILLTVDVSRPDLVHGDTDKPSVSFLTQIIFNACGTIALIHAVAYSQIEVDKKSAIGSVSSLV